MKRSSSKRRRFLNIFLSVLAGLAIGSIGISSFASNKDDKIIEKFYYDDMANDKYILGEYHWCLYDLNGNRNDITVDDIRDVIEYSKEYNIPDNIALAVLMASSDGYNYTKDSKSTAIGMYQVTFETGKYYYDKYLNSGKEYEHSFNLKSDFNIELGVKILGEHYNETGSLLAAIQRYKGIDEITSFTSKMNKYLSRRGISLDNYILD